MDLHGAVRDGDLDKIKRLIAAGEPLDTLNSYDRTPLHSACLYYKAEIVSLLLDHGADVNKKNKFGKWTALHAACEANAFEIVELLLKHGALVDIKNRYGATPLHTACENDYPHAAELLLKYNANVQARDDYGATPLHYACQGDAEMAEATAMLIVAGALVEATDNYGATPLHYACWAGNTNAGAVLLAAAQSAVDIDAQNEDGNTPLHYVSKQCHVELARQLIMEGADRWVPNKKGETPKALATDPEIIALFEPVAKSARA